VTILRDRPDQNGQSVRVSETRVPWNMASYLERVSLGCYVCKRLAGDEDFVHHIAYQDERVVVFLCKYPAVRAHLMVAPIDHRERVVGDFSEDEYVELQRVVHQAGRALESVVETERLYVLSLGSQQGNRHVHWHLVPLPPGVPYKGQQLALLSDERGWLAIPDEEMSTLASAIGAAIRST
jgi:diadenosine tetraphosphate (Ap4A) HIT family hydrolase